MKRRNASPRPAERLFAQARTLRAQAPRPASKVSRPRTQRSPFVESPSQRLPRASYAKLTKVAKRVDAHIRSGNSMRIEEAASDYAKIARDLDRLRHEVPSEVRRSAFMLLVSGFSREPLIIEDGSPEGRVDYERITVLDVWQPQTEEDQRLLHRTSMAIEVLLNARATGDSSMRLQEFLTKGSQLHVSSKGEDVRTQWFKPFIESQRTMAAQLALQNTAQNVTPLWRGVTDLVLQHLERLSEQEGILPSLGMIRQNEKTSRKIVSLLHKITDRHVRFLPADVYVEQRLGDSGANTYDKAYAHTLLIGLKKMDTQTPAARDFFNTLFDDYVAQFETPLEGKMTNASVRRIHSERTTLDS